MSWLTSPQAETTVPTKELAFAQDLFQKNLDHLAKQAKEQSKAVERLRRDLAKDRVTTKQEIESLRDFVHDLAELNRAPSQAPNTAVTAESGGVAPDVQRYIKKALEPGRHFLNRLQSELEELSIRVSKIDKYIALQDKEASNFLKHIALHEETANAMLQAEGPVVNDSTLAIAPVQVVSQDSTHDNVLPRRVGAMELAVSALISWKAKVDAQLDGAFDEVQQHAGPPEAHSLDHQGPQSEELQGEEPKAVSSEAAEADDNLDVDRNERSVIKNFDYDLAYEWEASVYDTMILIALPSVNFFHSLILILQLLCNVTMVGVTVAILGTGAFTSKPYTDIDSMLRWRYSDGHAASNVDPVSQLTLVSRVCSSDDTLSIGTEQKQLFMHVFSYERNGGPLLANVAVVLWVFCCSLELRRALRFVVAMLVLPKTKHTVLVQDDDGWIRFKGLSCSRRSLACFIFLVRLVAATALLIEGTIWLAYETSITDLLLNASALGFVLDIDNVIFEAIGSQRVRSLHCALKPMPLPRWKSLNFIPISIMAGSFGFMFYVNIALIDGVVSEGMKRLRAAICQPEDSLQLAFGSTPLGWVTFADVPYSDLRRDTLKFVSSQIIEGNVQGYAHKADSLNELQISSTVDVKFYVQDWPCRDQDNSMGLPGNLGQRLWAATDSEKYREVLTCQEARQYCRAEGPIGNSVRFLCAVTCGCAFGRLAAGGEAFEENIVPGNALLPHIDLLWDKAMAYYGCPEKGCESYKYTFLTLLPCEDANLSFLWRNGWNETLQQIRSTLQQIRSEVFPNEVISALSEGGCEELALLPPELSSYICGLSSASISFHAVAAVCPVSCHCRSADCIGSCPTECCMGAHAD